MVFVNGLEGMYIGAVDPLLITNETPIDYSQWEDGKPWHTKTSQINGIKDNADETSTNG